MLSPLLRRYTWNSTWLYNVRIFIALCGTVALPWWLNDVKLTIPLTLGVVAGALADLDDRLAGGVYATWSSRSSAFLLRQRPLSYFSPGPGCLPWV